VIHAKNEQQLLEETCQLAVVTGGYMMAWVGLAENDEAKTVRPIAQSGYEDGYLDGIKVTWSDTEFGQGPTGTAIRTGVVVVTQNCQTVPRMAPWREALIKRGYQSSIALPLVRNKRVFAALTIYSAEPGAFSNEEAVLLEELASNFSFGIETLRTREAQARAEQESRALSKHLQTVREEEKASFAREIHDELGGTLAALKMDAHWLAGKLPAGKETRPLQECAKSMIGLLDTAVLATRRIITDLRPTLLDDLGLMEALKWQSAQFQKRTGIECRFACAGGEDCEDRLDKVQSINLFRIFQETLTNVARHSGATRVEANLRHDDKEAALTISDNGRGLPEGHTIASTSYGLRGMRERVAQLGGKIKIDAPPGGGFRVKVILPLPAGNEK
jgi:signal transduction histidine kinase